MSVWLCIPSARPAEEAEKCLSKWRERGYKIALWRDDKAYGTEWTRESNLDALIVDRYPGYAKAVNQLVTVAMLGDPDAEWIVTGGDDVWPDPNHSAEEIAEECSEYFQLHQPSECTVPDEQVEREGTCDWHRAMATFGVMQPTGHRWGDAQGAYIDRIAGSPWMGREWCKRANQGAGPLYPGFTHMFEDECLRETAVMCGVYWERPDLTHFHNHWGLPREGENMGHAERMPEFLKKWNTPEHWKESKALFDRLKANGFKECLPL